MTFEGDRRTAAEAAAKPKTCPSCATRYPADALFCSLDGSPLVTSPVSIAVAATSDPYVGREILGHIEIRQLVGIGSMGRVYRAFQTGIDRDVAVKILHRELSANQTLVQRFHREAKVASRLAHPHVVHVLLVGQLPDGAMYIVMEYLDGLSLQSAVSAAGGAIPLPRALHIALQLCDAAGEAHAQDIVHRDLKPENVMLVMRADDPDYVKVLDFGIARLNWGEQSTVTAAGLIFGTARYISPEGAQGERVGPQGDVYSIATMTYQMLAGRTPFDAEQAVALLVQQIHDPPTPLKSIPRAAYVPEAIAAVIMKNLSKRPEDRADDARAFGRALLEAAVSSGLSAQDLLARPAMLGRPRGVHTSVVQMPSMQRTKQLQLDAEVQARMEGGSAATSDAANAVRPAHEPRAGAPMTEVPDAPPRERGRRATAYEEPAPVAIDAAAHAFAYPPLQPASQAATRYEEQQARVLTRTEIPEPEHVVSGVAGAPGAATTRWSPPADFEARRAEAIRAVEADRAADARRVEAQRFEDASRIIEASRRAQISHVSDPGRVAPPPSSVDLTMDDSQLPLARARLERPATPSPVSPRGPAPSSADLAADAPSSGAGGPRSRVDSHVERVGAPSTRTAPPPSTPAAASRSGLSSSLDTTTGYGEERDAEERDVVSLRSHGPPLRGRSLAVVVLCFFVGATGMLLLAWRAGLLARATHTPTLSGVVARANDALVHRRWDTPPGDNVRDLTEDGLARWPGDPQLLGVRALACDQILKSARERYASGEVTEALHLAQTAARVDPGQEEARDRVAEWTKELARPLPAVEPVVPPLSNGRPAWAGSGANGAPAAARAVVDASSSKPAIGQPVDFVAHLVGGAAHAKVESPRLRISGPGLEGGTDVPLVDDGSGAYRSTFTFFQAGRFDVSFTAKADGAAVRGGRALVVGEPKAAPSAGPEGDPAAPAPSPSSSANWL